jgi:hypothetical protein
VEMDIAQTISLLLGGGGTGAAGIVGLQKLGFLNGNGSNGSKEMTKVAITLENVVKALDPIAGILTAMRVELEVIASHKTSVDRIPVVEQKINALTDALKRLESDLKDIRRGSSR